jgi:hypothetical protein
MGANNSSDLSSGEEAQLADTDERINETPQKKQKD